MPVPFRRTEEDLPGRSTKAASSTYAGEQTTGSATKWKRWVNIETDFACPEDKFDETPAAKKPTVPKEF